MIADLEFYTQPNYQPTPRRKVEKITSYVFFLRELQLTLKTQRLEAPTPPAVENLRITFYGWEKKGDFKNHEADAINMEIEQHCLRAAENPPPPHQRDLLHASWKQTMLTPHMAATSTMDSMRLWRAETWWFKNSGLGESVRSRFPAVSAVWLK